MQREGQRARERDRQTKRNTICLQLAQVLGKGARCSPLFQLAGLTGHSRVPRAFLGQLVLMMEILYDFIYKNVRKP